MDRGHDCSAPPLTPMQLECVRRAVKSDKEIARDLAISPETVSSHIRAAMKRLGASSRREAMALLTVHPLYGSIVIPNIEIIQPAAPPWKAVSESTAPRPTLLGRTLPPLPGTVGRLCWVVGVFVGLGAMTIMGLALLALATQLISQQAPPGSA